MSRHGYHQTAFFQRASVEPSTLDADMRPCDIAAALKICGKCYSKLRQAWA
jgi:hypothetical protein